MTTLQTYIAEGFMEDCEQLIHRLTENYQQVDWHKFCYFWKEMQFDILFYGRQSGPEVVEFTEELLQTARLYIVTETDNFEDQVIGIFIAYAITIIQPYKNLCALRLIHKDVGALKKIEDKVRMDGRKDVLMILGKMYIYGNIQFHVSLRERAMDLSVRKYFDGTTNVPQCIARRWHGRLDRHRVYALEDIAQAESKYMDLKMKAKLAAESAFPGTNVKMDMFKPEAKHLAESLRKLISDAPEEIVGKEEDSHDVLSVKQRAMKNTVNPMGHLHGLHERKPGKKTKPPGKSKPRNKCRKLTQEPVEEPIQTASLPDLDDNSDDPDYKVDLEPDDPFHQIDRNREGSPQEPFRGFAAHEIQSNNSKDNLEHSKTIKKTYKGRKVKGISNSLNMISLEASTSKPLDMINLEPFLDRSLAAIDMEPCTSKSISIIDLEASTSKPLDMIDLEASTSKSRDMIDLEPSTSNGKNNSIGMVQSSNIKPANNNKLAVDTNNTLKGNVAKRKNTNNSYEEPINKKKKNQLNKVIQNSKVFNSNDSTDEDNTHEPEIIRKARQLNKQINIEACKGKELTIQTKGVVKHFMEYEVSDIVIRTEKDAPQNDIEIEYIDNYEGTNALYEEFCELSDDEESKKDKNVEITEQKEPTNDDTRLNDDVQVVTEESGALGNEKQDNDIREVFKIISGDRTETHSIVNTIRPPNYKNRCFKEFGKMVVENFEDAEVEETVKKILSKDNERRNMERRKLKQPNLRSKLKKMGLLPVANFEDDSN